MHLNSKLYLTPKTQKDERTFTISNHIDDLYLDYLKIKQSEILLFKWFVLMSEMYPTGRGNVNFHAFSNES